MNTYDTEYLTFSLAGNSPSGKTQVWFVRNKKSGDVLGDISWYGPWRQYTFDAYDSSIFNSGCLKDIATHLDKMMAERKVKRAATNAEAG